MSVIHGPNYGRPSLDLNFAKNKSLIDTVSGSNLVTFTRSSTGTYVGADGLIKTAATNEPRFDHDPVTGACNGLLIEESRTNRITRSVIDSNWSIIDNGGATIIPNSLTAPDGTLTAAFITFPGGVGVPKVVLSTSIASGNHTVSAWIKAKTGTVTIRVGNGNDYGSDQTVGTTWTRISYVSSSGSNSAGIYCSNSVSPAEFYAWGVQEEAGSFPTSYIPTSGSTVTRSADIASITGTNFSRWYNQSQGTVYANFPLGIVNTSGSNQAYLGLSNGTLNDASSVGDGIKYGTGSPATLNRVFVINSGTQVDSDSSLNSPKIGIAYATDNFAISRGGVIATDSSGSVPIVDRFTIKGAGSQPYARLTYYPTRLQDFQLQQLTK